MAANWIKLYREIREWVWYRDSYTLHTWIHLLLSANYKPSMYKGVQIERGQLATTVGRIASQTNISPQRVRTALRRLEACGELQVQSTNEFSVITICKFESYQSQEEVNQQTGNKPNCPIYNDSNKQLTNQSTNQTGDKSISYKDVEKQSNKQPTNETLKKARPG